MKAARLHKPGGPEQIVFEDAPTPLLSSGDALVRVHATGITPAELTWPETYHNCDGSDRIPSILGHEVSGVIEALAESDRDLRVGDKVYGLTSFCRDGAAAELVAVKADSLAPKPNTLTHAQAASVPLSALTAWQAFFNLAKLVAGQKVLIHGAAGGVGTFAVQLARWRRAYVIAVASGQHRDFLLDLGANEVVDYQTTRFELAVRDVDVVLDTIGGETRSRSWSVLKPDGILITLTGPISKDELNASGKQGLFFIVESNRSQLTKLAELIDSGEIRPIISEPYPLSRAREAFEHGSTGHNRGKLVLEVIHDLGA